MLARGRREGLPIHCKPDGAKIGPQSFRYPIGRAYIGSFWEKHTPAQVDVVVHRRQEGAFLSSGGPQRATLAEHKSDYAKPQPGLFMLRPAIPTTRHGVWIVQRRGFFVPRPLHSELS
jgi:hypothetical protein